MRTHHKRLCPAARLVFSLILITVMTGSQASSARAAGNITHGSISDRAINLLGPDYQDLKEFLTEYIGVVRYGSLWPDWVYAFKYLGMGDYETSTGDVAHDPTLPRSFRNEFMKAVLDEFRDSVRSVDDEKEIAFLFGMISHQEADYPWHFGEGTLTGIQPYAEALGISHTVFEIEADLLLYEGASIEWYFPAELVYNVYERVGEPFGDDLTPAFSTVWAQQTIYNGEVALHYLDYISEPFMTVFGFDTREEQIEFLELYYPGGLNHGASMVAEAWKKTWDWLKTYDPGITATISPPPPDPTNFNLYWFDQPVNLSVRAFSVINGVESELFDTGIELYLITIDGTIIQPFDDVFETIISAQGSHFIEIFACDSIVLCTQDSFYINIDMTPPEISGAPDGLPNSNGWYRSNVTVQFTAQDSLSGTCSLTDDTVLYTEGADQSVTGEAVDCAGNSASLTVSGINIDGTPPDLIGVTTPEPNSYGWFNSDVTVHFSAQDPLSGVDTVTPDMIFTSEGWGWGVQGEATDKAGNLSWAQVNNIHIDKTSPGIVIFSPQARSYLNTDRPYLALDVYEDLSGVASVLADLDGTPVYPGGIPLSFLELQPGPHTITVNVTDKAGNTSAQTVTFTIAQLYDIFLPITVR